MTHRGGQRDQGTVFRIDLAGNLTTLHSFDFDVTGAWPRTGLLRASNGEFYGTTTTGASQVGVGGTLFIMSSNGLVAAIYPFFGFDGADPRGELVEGINGEIYGMTSAWGRAAVMAPSFA